MFNKNLKILRNKNGLSQEDVASSLYVTRQTISKWERGLSTPDADLLIKLSHLFSVEVNDLLGATLDEVENEECISKVLAQINQELAVRNRRSKFIYRIIIGIVVGWIVIVLISLILSIISFNIYKVDPQPVQQTITEIF